MEPPANWGDEPWFAAEYRVILENSVLAELRSALSQIVADRNLLIHQRLATVDLKSIEDCQDLIQELDAQHERLAPHFKSAIRTLRSMTELRIAMVSLDFGDAHTPKSNAGGPGGGDSVQ